MLNNIRKVREELGMSIEDVAAKTGIMKPRDVERHEKQEFVQIYAVTILAKAMGVERSRLVDYAPGLED